MSPVRVALIGYGLAGSVFHAPLISVTPTMTLAAIVTAAAERQALARRAYPHAQILTSVDELWGNAASYDLVVVASPNRTHVALGIAALQAGLPVVIDKPLAASVADAERLLAVSKQTGLMLSVFQNRRWDGDFLTVQKILAAGLLGEVTRFESRFDRYRAPRPHAWREMGAPEEAGGLLYDLGSHLIDQVYMLFGKPTHVYAEMDQRRPYAVVDDDSFVALHFKHGVRAHLWMSLVSRLPAQRIRVNGLLGTYEKWGLDPQEDALRTGMRPGDAGWGQEPRERWGRLSTESGGSGGSSGVHIDGQVETVPGAYQTYYALLAEALLHGGKAPVDPLGVIDVLRVIEAAQKSAREGKVVELS